MPGGDASGVAAGSACPAEAQGNPPVADYVIGPGDVLNISVWKDEALTRQVVVLPDGKIAFPADRPGALPAARPWPS